MIFVTVGTNDFESLIISIDKVAPQIKDSIICQIGNNQYIPRNCNYFRFKESLEYYYKNASLIITHGGAGTLFRLLELGKNIIAVENIDCQGQHQKELLTEFTKKGYILWCKNLSNLEKFISNASHFNFNKYIKPKCSIDKYIQEHIK